MSEWKPINTAPLRDIVDLWEVSAMGSRRVTDCIFESGHGFVKADARTVSISANNSKFTHWMPLPDPPLT